MFSFHSPFCSGQKEALCTVVSKFFLLWPSLRHLILRSWPSLRHLILRSWPSLEENSSSRRTSPMVPNMSINANIARDTGRQTSIQIYNIMTVTCTRTNANSHAHTDANTCVHHDDRCLGSKKLNTPMNLRSLHHVTDDVMKIATCLRMNLSFGWPRFVYFLWVLRGHVTRWCVVEEVSYKQHLNITTCHVVLFPITSHSFMEMNV